MAEAIADVILENFGSMVFNDNVMQERLPEQVYAALRHTIKDGTELEAGVADVVAKAMKDWAVEKGATHYTHWFQPMTGVTAEKHDSFLLPENEKPILSFSGKELVKGEPDASSFPSRGLRATFEARGYTAWDPSSYAFIKDDSLCIPTVFCSYSSAVLDKKTPLLRSCDALNREALRLLHLVGRTDISRVYAAVGAEQEYFLVDRKTAGSRKDLLLTGHTLFGATPARSQELDDHYFGAIPPRVMGFMQELNEELWKLGIYARTEHNEVAPGQHELAPFFEDVNKACDHNQLTMEFMKKVAERHDMLCLLHEKPFAGVNGSGKHNNWSLMTDSGENLLKPGKHPENNLLFLLLVCAVLRGINEHQDLLRLSTSSAGNDMRLGGEEAPPAIVSVFLGNHIQGILDSIATGRPFEPESAGVLATGIASVPEFYRDTEDRNRTSPIAFTGNKFEFRMLGSSFSIACLNMMINTIVADTLSLFADILEQADDIEAEIINIIRITYNKHKRIIFNGNNYSEEWKEEAARRGLLNLPTTTDALPYYTSEKSVALMTRYGILTEEEIVSRYGILLEIYHKNNLIDARVMAEMMIQNILPSVFAYSTDLFAGCKCRKDMGFGSENDADLVIARRLYEMGNDAFVKAEQLSAAAKEGGSIEEPLEAAKYCRDILIPQMAALRKLADAMEVIMPEDKWPLASYEQLLLGV